MQRVILQDLLFQKSRNSPHFMEREVPLSLSVQPATCPYGIGCENVNCVQVFENVGKLLAFVEIGMHLLVA